MEMQVGRDISASSEQVWALVTGLDGSPQLLSGVTVDEGRRYEVVADAGSTDYLSVMAVESLGEDRCRLSMSFAAESSSVPGRLAAAMDA